MNMHDRENVPANQLSVWTGTSFEDIPVGHEFNLGGMSYKVEAKTRDFAKIVRLASTDVVAVDNVYNESPTQFDGADQFDVRDVFHDPSVTTTWEGPGTGYPPYRDPSTVPIPNKDFNETQGPDGGTIVEKVDVFDKELKADRPPASNIPGELSDTFKDYVASSVKVTAQNINYFDILTELDTIAEHIGKIDTRKIVESVLSSDEPGIGFDEVIKILKTIEYMGKNKVQELLGIHKKFLADRNAGGDF